MFADQILSLYFQQITTNCEEMNGVANPEKNTGTEEERETFLPLGQRSYLEKETSVWHTIRNAMSVIIRSALDFDEVIIKLQWCTSVIW